MLLGQLPTAAAEFSSVTPTISFSFVIFLLVAFLATFLSGHAVPLLQGKGWIKTPPYASERFHLLAVVVFMAAAIFSIVNHCALHGEPVGTGATTGYHPCTDLLIVAGVSAVTTVMWFFVVTPPTRGGAGVPPHTVELPPDRPRLPVAREQGRRTPLKRERAHFRPYWNARARAQLDTRGAGESE